MYSLNLSSKSYCLESHTEHWWRCSKSTSKYSNKNLRVFKEWSYISGCWMSLFLRGLEESLREGERSGSREAARRSEGKCAVVEEAAAKFCCGGGLWSQALQLQLGWRFWSWMMVRFPDTANQEQRKQREHRGTGRKFEQRRKRRRRCGYSATVL